MKNYNYIDSINPKYLDELIKQYENQSPNLDPEWKRFFEGFDYARKNLTSESLSLNEEVSLNKDLLKKHLALVNLIKKYRTHGHKESDLNPIQKITFNSDSLFLPELNGLAPEDLDQRLEIDLEGFEKGTTFKQIIEILKETYCSKIAFEYTHLEDEEMQSWFRKKLESGFLKTSLSKDEQKRAYEKISASLQFEEFLQRKYIGQKRFSLEGAESSIALIDHILLELSKDDTQELIMAMAHRGRLNVLAHIFEKEYAQFFYEFSRVPEKHHKVNDVKYHLGYSTELEASEGKKIKLVLMDNPSHLESVNPVMRGYARSRYEHYNYDSKKLCSILIHGDAAISGQGVVYEQLQMIDLEAYKAGATIHIVINNQLGYTANPWEGRSTRYCTDIAKAMNIPVIHVNADDISSVIKAADLAADFRREFQKDIFIDLISYRRFGHSEMDEPRFTQAEMYKKIDLHENILNIYKKELISRSLFKKEELDKIDSEKLALLNKAYENLEKDLVKYQANKNFQKDIYKDPSLEDFEKDSVEKLKEKDYHKIISLITKLPKEYTGLKQMQKIIKDRQSLAEKDQLNWAMAEFLAYGSILLAGKKVRIIGEDTPRGTFAHRHAILTDHQTGKIHHLFNPLLSLKKDLFQVHNSYLSEYGALGFEYGYSLGELDSLVIWEAQFGDFVNGAQIILDQYLSAGEFKWGKKSNLVLFLPHGQEGQGPEHSSARLERFLQMTAEDNMIVANLTSPANLYHILRRQVFLNWKKPLVIMSPKSLLRNPFVLSHKNDFFEKGFQAIITEEKKEKKYKKIIFCTGKIYYDLLKMKINQNKQDIAIFRLEQIYPFPKNLFKKIQNQYKDVSEWIWVQEEPKNMGAWPYLKLRYLKDWDCISRDYSPSPAGGYSAIYEQEQNFILNKALS